MNIGVVGLGTIGGSFAKAVKTYTGHRVFGADVNEDAVAFARFSDSIDGVLDADALAGCDLLVLALYPEASVDYLHSVAPKLKKDCVVLDCCGVKRAIFDRCVAEAQAHALTFIGGHPMAGAVASGFRASREKMFKSASMILVPGACDDLPVLDRLCTLLREIGFTRIVTCSPEEHDRMIAFTSQLPHVISNAYVKSPAAKNHRGFSAGSYRDMARVARLNVPMWTELFLENADLLTDELDTLISNLASYRDALANRDEQALAALLEEGASCKAEADASERNDERGSL